jgi:hypothetical protein
MMLTWLAMLWAAVQAAASGPFDIPLFAGTSVPAASGAARELFADSPFGVAVTADGHHSYDVRIEAHDLPNPSTLGPYHAYVAWEVSIDLADWHRLGAVSNGTTTVGRAEWNKFLLVITAEPDTLVTTHHGPIALHGTSPSGWLQIFLAHPLFRGISQ